MTTNNFIVKYYKNADYFIVDFEPYTRDRIVYDDEDVVSWLEEWLRGLHRKAKVMK